MRGHGKGTGGHRPYRGDFSRERMAAASYDLDRAIARAKAKEQAALDAKLQQEDLAKAVELLKPVFPEMFRRK